METCESWRAENGVAVQPRDSSDHSAVTLVSYAHRSHREDEENKRQIGTDRMLFTYHEWERMEMGDSDNLDVSAAFRSFDKLNVELKRELMI